MSRTGGSGSTELLLPQVPQAARSSPYLQHICGIGQRRGDDPRDHPTDHIEEQRFICNQGEKVRPSREGAHWEGTRAGKSRAAQFSNHTLKLQEQGLGRCHSQGQICPHTCQGQKVAAETLSNALSEGLTDEKENPGTRENYEQLAEISVSSDTFLMAGTSQDRGRKRGTTQHFPRPPDTTWICLHAATWSQLRIETRQGVRCD